MVRREANIGVFYFITSKGMEGYTSENTVDSIATTSMLVNSFKGFE
jgi:hypothetical protein